MKKVFCIGEALIDFVVETPDLDLSLANEFKKKAGGAAANVACAIAKLGGRPVFLGCVGNDPFGDFLEDSLNKEGVDLSRLQRADTFTTLVFVSLAQEGERDFVFCRGADRELRYEGDLRGDLKGNMLHLGAATALLGGPLEKAYGRYLFDGIPSGMFISFDPNFRSDLWKGNEKTFVQKCTPFIERAHLCKFSREEALLLSGKKEVEAACDHFHGLGSEIVVVTLGKEGSLLSCRGKKSTIPSVEVKAVDTTGAGDAFVGCLLHQISQIGSYEPLFEQYGLLASMVGLANRAGAISTTSYGAIPSLPNGEQLGMLGD